MGIDYTKYPLSALVSPVDHRDFITTAAIPRDIQLPSKFSFKDKIKTILNQETYGICVGCAAADMKNVQEVADNNLPTNGFSPVYLYTLAKQIDGIPNIWGTYPRAAMQVLSEKGTLPYDDMPVSVLDSSGGKLPTITQDQINKAMPQKISSYAQVPLDIMALKQAMVSTQSPVMISVSVTDSFYYPEQNKYIAKPNSHYYGGHEIVVIGYDDDMTYTYANGETHKGFIEIQNSWTANWANGGFAYIPYDALGWYLPAPYPYVGACFIVELWSSIDDHSDMPQPVKPRYWRIQTGAFSIKTNAQNYQVQLKQKGLSTYLVFVDNLWKVQLGAYLIEQNSRNYSATLKTQGINNFVVYY